MADKRVALLKRANKLFRQGKAEAAVKEYQKILSIKPDDLEVRRIVGDLQLREQNNAEAIEQFEWIADYYLKEGFFAKAIAMFKRITRVDPGYEGALMKLAELYTKQGLVMEAKQIYLDIAEECKRQNNQKKALGMYKKILEFDRSNIKMRLLLADNYLKEGLEDSAVEEYLIAADILSGKRDYQGVEELLERVLKKLSHPKISQKLIRIYTTQNKDDQAINAIKSLGPALKEDVDMLKLLGELYLKKNLMDEAEVVFSQIADLNPEETEVIMRLGKVYLHRDEVDKTFRLFLPVIDKNIQLKKYDEATALLRFIIASKNTFLPALTKLASIFKLSGKTNNLIALYESLIPIYEQKGMRDQLKAALEELIQLSDTPFSYEEQLARLSGQQAQIEEEAEQEKESEREREFVNYNLRVVDEAITVNDYDKAVDVLKKAKLSFPKNPDIRRKLFDIFLDNENKEAAISEGKGLLEVYKLHGQNIEYTDLVEKLSMLSPHDDKLVALSEDEKTSIDIDFDRDELQEQMEEIQVRSMQAEGEDDVLLLEESDNVTASPLQLEVESEIAAQEEAFKSLSSVLSEVDFYLNDGYFGDAEKLITQLKQKYPDNKALLAKIESLEQAKEEAGKNEETGLTGSGFEIEHSTDMGGLEIEHHGSDHQNTELIHTPVPQPVADDDFVIEHSNFGVSSEPPPMVHQSEDSRIEIDLGEIDMPPTDLPPMSLADSAILPPQTQPPKDEPEPPVEKTGTDVFQLGDFSENSPHIHAPPESSAVEIDLGEISSIDSPPAEGLSLADVEPAMPAPEEFSFEPESLNLEPEITAPEIPEPPGAPDTDFPPMMPPEPFQTDSFQAPPMDIGMPEPPELLSEDLLQMELDPVTPATAEPPIPMATPAPPEPIDALEPPEPDPFRDELLQMESASEPEPALNIDSSPDPFRNDLLKAESAAINEPDPFLVDPFPADAAQPGQPEPIDMGFDTGPPPIEDDVFQIESDISQETSMAQEHSDSKMNIEVPPESFVKISDSPPMAKAEPSIDLEEPELEIEMEAPEESSHVPELEFDKDLLIQSPSADSKAVPDQRSHSSSGIVDLDLDSIMNEEDSVYDLESPFKDDMTAADIAFDSEEDLLQEGGMFLEESYLEIEKNVASELEAISYWLKELEKQRTSTIEKNMMEIFEEFKRGVDEKIGQEDYDTRYNLGIAYKEMGLLEEAIHEFLISSKHPLKFFDSAGLLGMCFRDKGMFSEAISWFERALNTPERRQEEYLAIQFELVVTHKSKEEYIEAINIIKQIAKVDPSFRNVADIYNEIRSLMSRQSQ